jgi:hypothetical protein
MNAVGRMEEKCRSARACHRRRNFLPDETGLSHPGNYDLAFAAKQEIDGLGELGIQSIDEGLHRACFDPQHTPAFGEAGAVWPVGSGNGLGA